MWVSKRGISQPKLTQASVLTSHKHQQTLQLETLNLHISKTHNGEYKDMVILVHKVLIKSPSCIKIMALIHPTGQSRVFFFCEAFIFSSKTAPGLFTCLWHITAVGAEGEKKYKGIMCWSSLRTSLWPALCVFVYWPQCWWPSVRRAGRKWPFRLWSCKATDRVVDPYIKADGSQSRLVAMQTSVYIISLTK